MICVGLPKRCRGSAVACHVGRRSNCAPGRALPEEPVSGEGLPRPAHAEAPPPGELRHRGRAPSREGHRRWERGGRSWGGLRPTHARAPPPGKGRHRGRVTAAGEGSRCQVWQWEPWELSTNNKSTLDCRRYRVCAHPVMDVIFRYLNKLCLFGLEWSPTKIYSTLRVIKACAGIVGPWAIKLS